MAPAALAVVARAAHFVTGATSFLSHVYARHLEQRPAVQAEALAPDVSAAPVPTAGAVVSLATP